MYIFALVYNDTKKLLGEGSFLFLLDKQVPDLSVSIIAFQICMLDQHILGDLPIAFPSSQFYTYTKNH